MSKMTKIWKKEWSLHVMIFPSIIFLIIFSFIPMFGIIIAFQNFQPALGIAHSRFVGLQNFMILFRRPDFGQVIFNTIYIAVLKIIFLTVFGIILALLLNEITRNVPKKIFQTILFLPYFLSWALLGGILVELFGYYGSINYLLGKIFHIKPIIFLANNKWFRSIVIVTDLWKNLGYQIVVFLAVISNIDPTIYEAAEVDGANRFQQCMHITLPGMKSMIVLLSILSIGNILNAGFEQILVLYNNVVYETGDILDTMAYRIGLLSSTPQFSMSTAISLFKSIVGCTLFVISYKLADKIAGYRVL